MVACGPWLCFSLQMFLRSRIQIHLALAFHNTHLHRAPFDFSQRLLLLFLAILVFSSSSESAPADGVSVNGLARDDRFPWALVSKRSSLPPLAPPTVHLDLRPRPRLAPSPQASSSSVAAST